MSETSSLLSFRYQRALAPLAKQADASAQGQVRKRLSELLTLLDFNTTLNRSLALSEIFDILLFAAMGETRASWAGVLIRKNDGTFTAAARRGAGDPAWAKRTCSSESVEHLQGVAGLDDPEMTVPTREFITSLGAHLLVPLRKGGNLIGLLVLGPRAITARDTDEVSALAEDGADPSARQASVIEGSVSGKGPRRPTAYTEGERAFVEALSISAAACIDNGRIYEELRELNRSLSLKVYQLNSLFDVTRELHRAMDAGSVRETIVASAMGQLLATRCALIQPDGAIRARGVKLTPDELDLIRHRFKKVESLTDDVPLDDVEDETIREILSRQSFERLLPLRSGSSHHGVLVIGRKASGKPLSEEDLGFLRSLAAQGAASLDNLRLTREWIEKQKIEKELAVAREIQRELLPDRDPSLPGWDIAGINIPSLAVGGDYYDYLSGPGGRMGLAIADVSGKGTGPALLTANVQASLRALSGLGDLSIDVMLTRLNEQIFRNTEASKYVTVFYGWLDPRTAEFVYTNAGHCYPLLFRRGGDVERLIVGGPVIGLLPEVTLEMGSTSFRPGDMLVAYTDGLSETQSPAGEEFQEERIIEVARTAEDSPAREVAAKLVSEARIFAAQAGLGDDLTLMVVKRL